MDSKRQQLQSFLVLFVMPALFFYITELSLDKSIEGRKRIFLSREGWFMKKSFESIFDSDENFYLNASRGFLFKITSYIPEAVALALSNSFSGSFEDLLIKRFLLDRDLVRGVFSEESLSKKSGDQDFYCLAYEYILAKKDLLYKSTLDERELYLSYIDSLRLNIKECVFCDIGYSGTIQKLLTLLFQTDSYGAYLISSDPGTNVVGNHCVTMKGFLREGAKMGDGYFPLDFSLFLECILTSPYGQFCGLYKSQANDLNFLYGRAANIQTEFELVEAEVVRMIDKMMILKENGLKYSAAEVENIYELVVKNKQLIPSYIRYILNADDDVSGLGVVSPIEFFL